MVEQDQQLVSDRAPSRHILFLPKKGIQIVIFENSI